MADMNLKPVSFDTINFVLSRSGEPLWGPETHHAYGSGPSVSH